MHIALIGALVGVGVAILAYLVDYLLLRAGARERAEKLHRKFELDQTERKRLHSLGRFCLFLPAVFALLFWIFG